MELTELAELDTRYEGYRLINKRQEDKLLLSIHKQGIQEPVYIIHETGKAPILLDGHKRCRCAEKLNIKQIPSTILESKEVPGLLKFLRISSHHGLTQIEEACLVDELNKRHGLSVSEIASQLEKSPSWVSVRLGILEEMSALMREKILSGKLPFRNYMYTLRGFTRVKNGNKGDVDKFVGIVSGKGLSTRDIDMLAKGYFKGGEEFKSQIQQGNLDWTLQQLKREEKEKAHPDELLKDIESKALSQLNWTYLCIIRLPGMLNDNRLENKAFFEKGRKLAKKILDMKDSFISSLEYFYDKAG